jgi:hypothetical protein
MAVSDAAPGGGRDQNPHRSKKTLSANWRKLVELMQDIGFGQIHNLVVTDGEPIFDPPPRVVRVRKFGRRDSAIQQRPEGDFELKAEIVYLMFELRSFSNGVVDVVEIVNGLPVLMRVSDVA